MCMIDRCTMELFTWQSPEETFLSPLELIPVRRMNRAMHSHDETFMMNQIELFEKRIGIYDIFFIFLTHSQWPCVP